MATQAFVFRGEWEAEVYRYLRSEFRAEVNGIIATTLADDGNDFDSPTPLYSIAEKLRTLLVEQSPIPCDQASLPVLNKTGIFCDLLAAAIDRLDFETIASALFQDVELLEWSAV